MIQTLRKLTDSEIIPRNLPQRQNELVLFLLNFITLFQLAMVVFLLRTKLMYLELN